jgi:hypothetical protein
MAEAAQAKIAIADKHPEFEVKLANDYYGLSIQRRVNKN